MAETLNTFVDFLADFPYESGWVYDPTKDLPGKDLSELLVKGLRGYDIEVKAVDAVDYGHFITVLSGVRSFTILVTVDDVWEMRRWNVHCHPTQVVWPWHSCDIEYRNLLSVLHQVLKKSSKVRDIRWFPGFEGPVYLDARKAAAFPFPLTESLSEADSGVWDRDLDGIA